MITKKQERLINEIKGCAKRIIDLTDWNFTIPTGFDETDFFVNLMEVRGYRDEVGEIVRQLSCVYEELDDSFV